MEKINALEKRISNLEAQMSRNEENSMSNKKENINRNILISSCLSDDSENVKLTYKQKQSHRKVQYYQDESDSSMINIMDGVKINGKIVYTKECLINFREHINDSDDSKPSNETADNGSKNAEEWDKSNQSTSVSSNESKNSTKTKKAKSKVNQSNSSSRRWGEKSNVTLFNQQLDNTKIEEPYSWSRDTSQTWDNSTNISSSIPSTTANTGSTTPSNQFWREAEQSWNNSSSTWSANNNDIVSPHRISQTSIDLAVGIELNKRHTVKEVGSLMIIESDDDEDMSENVRKEIFEN
jgi:hypothetical protein